MSAGVGGDEQDRRGQHADVQLAGGLQRPEVDLLDDAEDRVAREAAFVLGSPSIVRYSPSTCSTGSAESATAGSVK